MTGSDRIEHLVFANSGGMRLVAASIEDPSRRDSLGNRLDRFIRLEPFHGQAPPATGLSYLRLDHDVAAVIHRADDGVGSTGRNRAEVLLGSPHVLTPVVALGLDNWPRWGMPYQEILPPVPPDVVARESRQADRHLSERVQGVQQPLRRVLAAMVDRPDDRMMLLGAAWDDAVPLLWGLHRIADASFARAGHRQDWTFSTYESRPLDTGSAPRLVFLPGRPDSATTRVAVNIRGSGGTPPVSDGATRWAAAAVQSFLKGADVAKPPLVAHPQLVGSTALTEVAGGEQRRGGRSRRVETIEPDSGHAPPEPATRGSAPPSRPQEPPALPDSYHRSGPDEERPDLTKRPAVAPVRPTIAARLLGLPSVDAFDDMHRSLPPADVVRETLTPAELTEVFEHLAGLDGSTDQNWIAKTLLEHALGRGFADLEDESGSRYALDVIALSAEEAAVRQRARPLVQLLVKECRRQFGDRPLTAPVVNAFLRDLGLRPTAPEPQRAPRPERSRRSFLAVLRSFGAVGGSDPDGRFGGRASVLGLVAVAVVVLGIVVSLALLAPSSSPAPQRDPVPGTGSAAVPGPPVEVGPVLPSGLAPESVVRTVRAEVVPDGQVVFVLYRSLDNRIVLGPDCGERDEIYTCVAGEPPAGFDRVQVGTATEQARDANRGRTLAPDAERRLPGGITVVESS